MGSCLIPIPITVCEHRRRRATGVTFPGVLFESTAMRRASRVGAAAGAAPGRPTSLVELDHLNDVLAPDAAIVNRDRVHTRVHVDQFELERRFRTGDATAPIRTDCILAAQYTRRRKAALGDQR